MLNGADAYVYDPYIDHYLIPDILTYTPGVTAKDDAEILIDIREQLFLTPFVEPTR